MVLLNVFAGRIVAVSCTGDDVVVDAEEGDIETLVAAMDTDTGMEAVFAFDVVAVMVVAPFAIGVMSPEELTVAILGLLLIHVMALLVVSAGRIVVVSCTGDNVVAGMEVGAIETLVAGIAIDTDTDIAAVFPFIVLTVSIVVPFAIGTTSPEAFTDTIEGLPLVHVRMGYVVFAGEMVAVSCTGVVDVAVMEVGAIETLVAWTTLGRM